MFDQFSGNRNKELQEYIVRMAYLAEINEWDNRTHLERIRRFCAVLCAGLNLTVDESDIISSGAQLHDIGKSLTPESILKKAGNYTKDELLAIQRHTFDGALILEGSRSAYLAMGETIALTHHERWDGSGYPGRLQGTAIPLGGRICAIVDVFDALTTKRNYKQVVGVNEALKLVKDSAGTLFDPALVKIFENRFDELVRIKQAIGEGRG
jgi:putative two-component system response regulator